jgi:hypothetical protein
MRSIINKSALMGAAASVLLTVSPAYAANDQEIIFVPGTGEVLADESSAPAPFADERAEPRNSQAEMMALAEKLSNPRMQDGVAQMIGNMTDKMLDLPVGKFAAAIEKPIPGSTRSRNGRHIRENDTLADLAGRDADRLPSKLADGSRQMMGMMSSFAEAFATMIPEFEKLSREMERSFEDIKQVRDPDEPAND